MELEDEGERSERPGKTSRVTKKLETRWEHEDLGPQEPPTEARGLGLGDALQSLEASRQARVCDTREAAQP